MFPEQRGTHGPWDTLLSGGALPGEAVNIRRLLEMGQLPTSATPRRRRAEEPGVLEPRDELARTGGTHVFDLIKADLRKFRFVAVFPDSFLFVR